MREYLRGITCQSCENRDNQAFILISLFSRLYLYLAPIRGLLKDIRLKYDLLYALTIIEAFHIYSRPKAAQKKKMSQVVNFSPQRNAPPTYSVLTMLPEDILSDITTVAGIHALANLWCCGDHVLLSKMASSAGIRQFAYQERFLQDLHWFPTCTQELKGLKSFELSSSFWGTPSSCNVIFPRFTGRSLLLLPVCLEKLVLNFRTSAERLFQAFSLGFNFQQFPQLRTLEIISTIEFGSGLLTDLDLGHDSNNSIPLPPTLTKLDLALGTFFSETIIANLPSFIEDLTLQDATHVNTTSFSCLPHLHSLKLPNCFVWSYTTLKAAKGSQNGDSGTLLKLPQILSFEAPILGDLRLEMLPNVTSFVGLSTIASAERIKADMPHLRFLELKEACNATMVDLNISLPFSDKLIVLKLEHEVTGPLSQVTELLRSLGPHLTSLELPTCMRLGNDDFGLLPKNLKILNAAWEVEKMSLPTSVTYLISKNRPSCEFIPDLRHVAFLPDSLHIYRFGADFVFLNYRSFIQPSGYQVGDFIGAWHSSWTNIELAARQDCTELVKACLELSPLSATPKVNRKLLEWVITSNAINTLNWMDSNDMIPKLRVTHPSSLISHPLQHVLLWNNQTGTGFHEFMDAFLFLAITGVPSTSEITSYLLVTRGFRFSPSAPKKLLEPLVHRSARFGLTRALDFWWAIGLHEDLNSVADVPCGRPSTPLDIAIAHRHWHVMEWLHQHGASLLHDIVEFPPASLGLHLQETFLSQCSSSGATRSQVQILKKLLDAHGL